MFVVGFNGVLSLLEVFSRGLQANEGLGLPLFADFSGKEGCLLIFSGIGLAQVDELWKNYTSSGVGSSMDVKNLHRSSRLGADKRRWPKKREGMALKVFL